MAKRKMAANASPASAHSAQSLSERRAILSSASTTMASTAALMPTNKASTAGTLPKAA